MVYAHPNLNQDFNPNMETYLDLTYVNIIHIFREFEPNVLETSGRAYFH